MTAGNAAAQANGYLNLKRATNITSYTPYVQLHTADPGAAGTTAVSAVTTRNAATFAAPSGGSMALSSIGTWAMTASETITHISIWDASTSGNFKESWPLTSSVAVVNGSTFSLTALTLTAGPVAA